NAKENKFFFQHGSKLHSYGRDKAPYPLSYNREVMELSLMDRSLMIETHKSVSFVDFNGKLPKRCLDVGTGMGDWVIEASKSWPDCTFVGFDLVNVQIPLETLPSSIADRIQWVYGNLLRISSHSKTRSSTTYIFTTWDLRSLRMEDDAIFPILPRWFTEPLHARSRVSPQEGSHEYELLEMLYYDVFNNRLVNATPTAIMSVHFSIYFGQVVSPPVATFSMPPLAPLTPAPFEISVSTQLRDFSDYKMDPDAGGFLPQVQVDTSDFSLPNSLSTSSESTAHSTFSESSTSTVASQSSEASGGGPASEGTAPPRPAPPPHRTPPARATRARRAPVQLGKAHTLELFPRAGRRALCEHSPSMQLYRALWIVLGMKEAMFEELMVRVARGDGVLAAYGWGAGAGADSEAAAGAVRGAPGAVQEVRGVDVMVRIALWNSLVLQGWPFPRRDPLSKAEQMEEERLRQEILEARQAANEEELKDVVRSVRVIVGQKM
ncbi:hypothetical protein B0H21DRAFT_866139, partial [Amylocystis lapponica]